MNRVFLLVAALFALACGSSNEPSAPSTSSDAGAPGEKTQSQSEPSQRDASTSSSGASDGETCSEDDACEHGHCVNGICCKQACTDPGRECRSIEDATCEGGETCSYPISDDGAACEDADACTVGSVCKDGECQKGEEPRDCDDNNPCTDDSCDPKLGCKNQNNEQPCDDADACTQNDVCKSGECRGSQPRDCSAEDDACNQGVCDPKDGSCKREPVADGASCDDADSCSENSTCQAGQCQGDNACGPNATQCRPGPTRECSCEAGYRASGGRCVPDSDECEASPCAQNADCVDPSNAVGDVTCTCKPGFAGDGKQSCEARDPCEGNPCGEGRGTCTASGDTYSCSCGTGFRALGGQCVCDMQGTFAVRNESTASWADIDGIEDGTAQGVAWAIARHSYTDGEGVSMELIPCGETNVDVCGMGVRIAGIAAEAYSQYVPISVWDKAAATSTLVELSLPNALPGGAYKTPRFAILNGISLADPLGEWPARRQDIQGGNDFDGTATNGARWLDTDQDALFGSTTYTVGPNGETLGGDLAPITPYAQTSAACPRGDATAARLPYNHPPGLDGLTPRRIKRFSSASRVISELDGTIESCDVIKGSVTGPDNGRAHMDVRIGSCVRVDGNSGEVACSSNLLDFVDESEAPSAFDSQTFIMKRVDPNVTCAQVRALSF